MMTAQLISKAKRSLILHEGWNNKPYVDSFGKITIGCGYNLSERGVDDFWIAEKLMGDIVFFYKNLCEFPWYHLLNDDRQVALIDMAFMGWKKFLEFTKMFEALENRNYKEAAQEMLNSDWAKEVKERAINLALAMEKGVYNV